jgi:hypothetical protein
MNKNIKVGDDYKWEGHYFDGFVLNGKEIDTDKLSDVRKRRLIEKESYKTKYLSGINKIVSIEEIDFCGQLCTKIVLDNNKEMYIGL